MKSNTGLNLPSYLILNSIGTALMPGKQYFLVHPSMPPVSPYSFATSLIAFILSERGSLRITCFKMERMPSDARKLNPLARLLQNILPTS